MAGSRHDWTPRRAGDADAAAIARLHVLVRRTCLPYLPELHTSAQVEAFFRDVVLVKRAVWCVVSASDVTGFIAFGEGWVDHLYVHPAHHSGGMGTALLRLAQAASPSLQLWVFQRNGDAIRFYEKRGFILQETTDGSGNEEHEPDARMSWQRRDDWPS